MFLSLHSALIREQDPLKQGLKPIMLTHPMPHKPIREQDPLKQGLKLIPLLIKTEEQYNSRARSIKTRIET